MTPYVTVVCRRNGRISRKIKMIFGCPIDVETSVISNVLCENAHIANVLLTICRYGGDFLGAWGTPSGH